MRINVKNLGLLQKQLEEVKGCLAVERLNNILFEGMELIRQDALDRLHTVYAQHTATRKKPLTGTLEMSLKTYMGKSRKYGRAYTKAKGSDRIANHAHLVEYGHRQSRGKLARIKKLRERLRFIKDTTVKQEGWTPAHPFFRPAVKSMRNKVKQLVIDGIEGLVQKRRGMSGIGAEHG